MPSSSNISSINRQDIAILALFVLSYFFGVVSTWIVRSVPLTEGNITLYKILLGTAALFSISVPIGAVFLFLTRVYVLDPIRRDLEEATVDYDGERLTLSSGGASEDVYLPISSLKELGYTDVYTDDENEKEGTDGK